jgi:hypothetical protein
MSTNVSQGGRGFSGRHPDLWYFDRLPPTHASHSRMLRSTGRREEFTEHGGGVCPVSRPGLTSLPASPRQMRAKSPAIANVFGGSSNRNSCIRTKPPWASAVAAERGQSRC